MHPSDAEPSNANGEGVSLTTALHDCLASGVLVVDAAENITACAPETRRLLRLPEGQPALSLASLPQDFQKAIRNSISTRRPIVGANISFAPPGEESVVLQVTVLPIRNHSTNPEAAVVINDVSTATRLERNLRRLDRLASIGTLSTSMVHEIKNALVGIKTFVDLLLEQNRDAELADVVRRELTRVDSMVTQMLRYSAPARPAFASLRLHELLDHSLRVVQHQIESKQIALQRLFNAAPDAFQGDDYQLEQAFVNLLLNAVESMPAHGSLTLSTESVSRPPVYLSAENHAQKPQLLVAITDTGAGISPENQMRVFDPFFTTKTNGTGLGLTITREILQEHKGDIHVQSELNKGTTFTILLPAGPASN